MVSVSVRAAIETLVSSFLKQGQPFTGYDVVQKGRQERTYVPHQDTSAYVRELFNKGLMPGWASTQVIPKEGPVLYFKLTSSMTATKEARRIRELIQRKVDGKEEEAGKTPTEAQERA
jgi:hypothetical protein